MEYDKIKDKFAKLIDSFPLFRKLFYLCLDFLLLRQWYVKKEIKKYFPKNKQIDFYDAGAGFGQYSWFILKNWKNAQVHAIDSFSRYIKGTKKFSSQQADLVEYIPNKKFDLIIAIDILEHIEEDEKVLNNFRKVLKEHGKLIISSPSNYDESAKFTAEHVRAGYSKKEIITKLNAAGFKIRSFRHSYGKFGHIAWLLTMKFPLSLLEKNKLYFAILPFYYLFSYPISAVLMFCDLNYRNKIGTGVFIVAE